MSEPLPAAIGRIDPARAWEHWAPDARDPWNARWAGHLFRRAAFGAGPERVASAVRRGDGARFVDGKATAANLRWLRLQKPLLLAGLEEERSAAR